MVRCFSCLFHECLDCALLRFNEFWLLKKKSYEIKHKICLIHLIYWGFLTDNRLSKGNSKMVALLIYLLEKDQKEFNICTEQSIQFCNLLQVPQKHRFINETQSTIRIFRNPFLASLYWMNTHPKFYSILEA